MHRHILTTGTKILHDGVLAEVVAWVETDKLQIIDSSHKIKIINIGEVQCVIDHTTLQTSLKNDSLDISAFDAEQLSDAQRKYDVITKHLEEPADRPVAEAVAQDLACSSSYAYTLIRRYARGSFSSLIKEKRGRKVGTRRLASEVESIIDSVITASEGPGSSINAISEAVKTLCENAGYAAPSTKTIALRVSQRSPKDNTKRVHGGKKSRQDHLVRGGKHLTKHALELVQIDHCIIDAIVVDSTSRKPIGRPWLTIAIDVHTRSVIGFYLSLHHPSAVSNAACLVHSVTPKHGWLSELKLNEVQYPMYGLPQHIHVDNGKDFRSAAFILGCKEYGIKLTWRPPGSPHYGGHIERYIGTLMKSMRGLPGAILSSVADKARYSNLKEPGMTLNEMRDWIIEQVGIYHMKEHSELRCSPLLKWEKSHKNKDGKIIPPAIVGDFRKFAIDFLPFKRGSIQRSGVTIHGVQYYAPALKRFSIKTSCIIKFNPQSISKIWVKPVGEGSYIQCDYSDVRLPDCFLAELKAARKELSAENKSRVPVAMIFAAVERNRERVAAATQKTSRMRREQEKQKTLFTTDLNRIVREHPPSLDYSRQPKTYDVE